VTDTIRVVVADDQTTIREAVAAMLDLQPDIDVVATAADGAELVSAVAQTTPDVVLTDLRMPGVDGAAATRQIGESHPGLPVVVLTTFDDDASVFAALDAGAVGYLTKDADRHELAAAIRAAAAGQSVLDRSVQQRLVAAIRPSGTPGPGTDVTGVGALTAREREVLVHMADGLSNREIAATLFVSESTVKTHINNAFAKLDVRDRAQAVALAYRSGIARG
jgi:DNA-binding NarL/FixJ family response regulator